MKLGTAQVIRANSRSLPLADNSVDLVVTSPPYFALRSYQDGGEHYAGQIGDEPTPAEFVASLLEVTAECVRVLKPSGSLWVNLGDKYATRYSSTRSGGRAGLNGDDAARGRSGQNRTGVAEKSLIGIPWRYALACIDDLGLILRAEVIWSKPNGLPESVKDRVRRSHEQWFHFTLEPRYFSAVDEIREAHVAQINRPGRDTSAWTVGPPANRGLAAKDTTGEHVDFRQNPLGKLPGSVWTVATEPLRVPDHLGIDHFAAFPTEWPKRIIQGWSPVGVCVECGEGRRPVIEKGDYRVVAGAYKAAATTAGYATGRTTNGQGASTLGHERDTSIVGYTCACDSDGYRTARGLPLPDTTPAVVLDPFGGTGTTALVAKALGRHGISVDMSADYCRLAEWRTNDRDQLAKVLGVAKAEQQPDDQTSLLDLIEGPAA